MSRQSIVGTAGSLSQIVRERRSRRRFPAFLRGVRTFLGLLALLALSFAPLAARAQEAASQGRAVILPVSNTRFGGIYGPSSRVPGVLDLVNISTGVLHRIGLRADGSLVSWGNNSNSLVSGTPTGTGFKAVAAGRESSAALSQDGSIVCWGFDFNGSVSGAPTGTGFTALALGDYHGVALASDGSLVAWGIQSLGRKWVVLSALCALTITAAPRAQAQGALVAWGYNSEGQVSGTPTTGTFTATGGVRTDHDDPAWRGTLNRYDPWASRLIAALRAAFGQEHITFNLGES